MQVTVTGEGSFKRFALGCHRAAGPAFERHMDRGLKEAAEDLAAGVRAATDIFMPSGYEEIFRARLLHKVDLHKPQRRATLVMYARGRSGRRDVERLERGELRHPVFGRFRTLKSGARYKNPWSVTTIRPGFFSVPFRFGTPQAVKRLDQALARALAEAGK